MALGCCWCATLHLKDSYPTLFICFLIFCFITLHTGNFVVAFIGIHYTALTFSASLFTLHFYVSRFGLHPPSFHIWLHFFLDSFFLYSVDVIIATYLSWTRKFVSHASETKQIFFLLFMCRQTKNKTKHAPTATEEYYMLHHFVAGSRREMGICDEENTNSTCATVVNWKFHFSTSLAHCNATQSDAHCTGIDCHTIVTFFCTKNRIHFHIYPSVCITMDQQYHILEVMVIDIFKMFDMKTCAAEMISFHETGKKI